MSISKDEARQMLHENELRATAPRIAVLRVLAEAANPLSHTQVLARLGETDWDQATIYRNLVKLRDAGIAKVVSRADGIDRYALSGAQDDDHCHPHFVCADCGTVECLPEQLSAAMSMKGPWEASVEKAVVQLHGVCPDCLDTTTESPR
jgi:Fur family ferric uptake transcriptional regulator